MYVCMYVCMYIYTIYICAGSHVYTKLYACMYVYFNEGSFNRVLVRLGLNTLIGWLQLNTKFIVRVGWIGK